MNRSLIRWTLALVCLAPLIAAHGENETADRIRKRWETLYANRAESLSVSFAESGRRPIRLHPQPVLTYTNPVRNVQGHGSVFLWTEAGRPVLVAAYWSVVERDDPATRRLSREWHSLTTDNVVVGQDGGTIWTSSKPGIEWQSLVEADGPLKSRSLRLSQMRRIARRLHAEIETAEGDLRLMPQPIYRYPATAGVLDGGVFAFVLGTDPELLAVVEARESANGSAEWFLGFAHLTNVAVDATLDGSVVYQSPRWDPITSAVRHDVGIAIERHPANLPE